MTLSDQLHGSTGLAAFPAVLDIDLMSDRVASLLGERDEIRVSAARLVGGKRGERAVVAYDTVTLNDPVTLSDTVTLNDPVTLNDTGPGLIGKVFADQDRARRLHDLLTALSRTDFAGDDYLVPRPLAYLPDLGMVLYLAASGRPLDCVESSERTGRVVAAARWLATLHGSRIDLDRRLDLATETRNLAEWAELVVRERPVAAEATARLLERIGALVNHVDVQTGVTIHKDFHYQHTLFEGAQVTVIDLDEARSGDPAFDVAHFAANLRLLALREATPKDEPRHLERAFLDGYASCTGYEIDARHELFHAYTCLKIAKQLGTGRGPLPVPAGSERDRQIDLILREGLRCPGR